MRSCNDSTVSPRRRVPPLGRGSSASTSSVTRCTVHPVTFTPNARRVSTACQPGKAGSNAGCVLRFARRTRRARPAREWCQTPAIATRSRSWRAAASTTSSCSITVKSAPVTVAVHELGGDAARFARQQRHRDGRRARRHREELHRASPKRSSLFPMPILQAARRPTLPARVAPGHARNQSPPSTGQIVVTGASDIRRVPEEAATAMSTTPKASQIVTMASGRSSRCCPGRGTRTWPRTAT